MGETTYIGTHPSSDSPTIKEERLEIQSGVQSHKIKLFEGTPQLARTSAT